MTSPRTPITVAEAAERDARQTAPPILVTDGDHTEVGAAHGRILPLIGNKRPYTYDVSLPGRQRIYADTPEDVVATILGGDYAELLARTVHLEDVGDIEASEQVRIELIRRRHKHADGLRLAMQQQINDLARQDGSWDALDDSEQTQLTLAADPNGEYPVGIATEIPVLDDDGTEMTAWRGMWFATVPLVLNTGDYAPFSDALAPESCLTERDDAGRDVVVPGDPNLVVLNIDDSVTYLESLEKYGWLELTVRPAEQPDPIFRNIVIPPA